MARDIDSHKDCGINEMGLGFLEDHHPVPTLMADILSNTKVLESADRRASRLEMTHNMDQAKATDSESNESKESSANLSVSSRTNPHIKP